MADTTAQIQVYNPDKQISEQVTLKRIVEHDVAMALARTGLSELPGEKPSTPNDRTQFRFKGLNQIISSQQCLITNARPIVRANDEIKWRKQNKTDDEKKENPFEKEDNSYNELLAILDFLDGCEQQIIIARRTKRLDDDFVLEKEDHEGEMVLELSQNFFKMLKELEESYEVIYGIMLENKIVSSGVSTDEEVEDKQKEEEAMRRIIES